MSERSVSCSSKLYKGTKFCVRRGDNVVSSSLTQMKSVGQGCSLSPSLFNIFIVDITENVTEINTGAPVFGDVTTPELLYAGGLAVVAFKVNGLQKADDQLAECCGKES